MKGEKMKYFTLIFLTLIQGCSLFGGDDNSITLQPGSYEYKTYDALDGELEYLDRLSFLTNLSFGEITHDNSVSKSYECSGTWSFESPRTLNIDNRMCRERSNFCSPCNPGDLDWKEWVSFSPIVVLVDIVDSGFYIIKSISRDDFYRKM